MEPTISQNARQLRYLCLDRYIVAWKRYFRRLFSFPFTGRSDLPYTTVPSHTSELEPALTVRSFFQATLEAERHTGYPNGFGSNCYTLEHGAGEDISVPLAVLLTKDVPDALTVRFELTKGEHHPCQACGKGATTYHVPEAPFHSTRIYREMHV